MYDINTVTQNTMPYYIYHTTAEQDKHSKKVKDLYTPMNDHTTAPRSKGPQGNGGTHGHPSVAYIFIVSTTKIKPLPTALARYGIFPKCPCSPKGNGGERPYCHPCHNTAWEQTGERENGGADRPQYPTPCHYGGRVG